MLVIVRAIVYATIFVSLVLIYVPATFLSWSGLESPASIGWKQILGLMVGTIGAAIALWCVLAFAFVGRGTPAPFDPPRKLVVRGPYRFVRNPMYIGAGMALGGASLYCGSLPLLGYLGVLFVMTNLFIFLYEEPVLRKMFGHEYEEYCARVGRWWPKFRA